MTFALAVLTALFVWWFATGAVLYMTGVPRRARPWTLAAATVALLGSLAVLVATREMATPAGAYLGFLAAMGIWGWHELMFLTGRITGPRTTPQPAGVRGFRRFRCASEAVLWHEIALAATLAAIAALTLSSDNRVALATFAVLWVMRLSAKLNVFLGVRNLSEEFLPRELVYLESYFRRAPMNPLLPVSVIGGLVAAAVLYLNGLGAAASGYQVVAAGLVGTLLALAVLEHVLMVVPVSATALWQWGLAPHRARRRQGPPPSANLPAVRLPHRVAEPVVSSG